MLAQQALAQCSWNSPAGWLQPSACACERFPGLHLSWSFATRQMWPWACVWPRRASTTWAAPGTGDVGVVAAP